MLSVAEVCEMQPGDEHNATWINPGFIARVGEIQSTNVKKTGKPMHICTLHDTVGSASISMTVFTNKPGFDTGDTIEVSGKGLRRSEFRGLDQVSVGRETEIHVVSAGAAPAPRAAASAGAAQPRDRSAAPAEAARPGDSSEFHRTMKKMSLMYCHAMDYAAAIDKRTPFHTPEQMQACTSTLFIEGARRNLIDIAPERGAAAAKPAPAPAPKPAEGADEDVPF